MTNRKITQEKINFINHAVRFGVPMIIIAEVCEVNYQTITKHTKVIREDLIKKFTPKTLSLEMLKLYAWALVDPDGFTTELGYSEKMKTAIYRYLQLEKWLIYIQGVLNTINSYEEITFDPEITLPYQNLIRAIFNNERQHKINSKDIFTDIIKDIFINKKCPDAENIKRPDIILKPFLEKVLIKKKKIGFFIPKKFQLNLIKKIPKILTENQFKVINYYYNLNNEDTIELKDMVDLIGTSKEKIRQLKESSLLKIKKDVLISNIPDWCNSINIILYQSEEIENLSNKLMEMEKLLNKVTSAGELIANQILIDKKPEEIYLQTKKAIIAFLPYCENQLSDNKIMPEDYPGYNTAQLENLLKHRNDLDLNVRLYNCLKGAKIYYLWQLCQYKLTDLEKFRNLGKKSLAELEYIVKENGLSFGIEFDPVYLKFLEKKSGIEPKPEQ